MDKDSNKKPPYRKSSELPFKGKLLDDTFNDWYGGVSFFCSNPDDIVLHPIRHYEERQRAIYVPQAADEIIAASDPDAMRAYNQIVDEFNAEIDRINREKIVTVAKTYLERITEVLGRGRHKQEPEPLAQ